MFRRFLLASCTLLFLLASPAAAQSYGDILGEGQDRNPTVIGGGQGVGQGAAAAGDGLAATGSNLVPLIQAAIVLIVGGSLLAFVARRRRAERRLAAA